MNYKVGDKVRITKHAEWCSLVGEICVVIEINPLRSDFICRVKHKSNWDCLMFEKEVEKMPVVGMQLMFAFMSEAM